MSALYDGTECTLVMFANDTELGGVARPDGCTAIQRNLYRLEKLPEINLIKFSKGKCKVLHLRKYGTSTSGSQLLSSSQIRWHS